MHIPDTSENRWQLKFSNNKHGLPDQNDTPKIGLDIWKDEASPNNRKGLTPGYTDVMSRGESPLILPSLVVVDRRTP